MLTIGADGVGAAASMPDVLRTFGRSVQILQAGRTADTDYAAFFLARPIGTSTGTTWASPLVYAQNLTSEFVEYLLPMTFFGKIQGLTRVPFNTRIPRDTAAISFSVLCSSGVRRTMTFD